MTQGVGAPHSCSPSGLHWHRSGFVLQGDGESPDSEITPTENWGESSLLPGGGVEVQAPDLILTVGWGGWCVTTQRGRKSHLLIHLL